MPQPNEQRARTCFAPSQAHDAIEIVSFSVDKQILGLISHTLQLGAFDCTRSRSSAHACPEARARNAQTSCRIIVC